MSRGRANLSMAVAFRSQPETRTTTGESESTMERRSFVAAVAGATASQLVARPAVGAKKTIAIQFGAVSLVDEGVESVLDVFQNRAGVNMLMPAVFSFSNGTAGRQLPGHPFPDHGKQQDEPKLRGGNFARVHPQYYRDAGIDVRLTQAPDHPDLDLIGDLLPAARKRGMQVVGLIQDDFAADFPGVDRFREVDFNGQRAATLCKNNPYYRNFLAGLVEDFTRTYDIDGLMFVCEQQGAFSNILGSRLRGKVRGLPGSRACFCEFCREKARKQGIQFERVVKGFKELEKFVAAGRSRKRPIDGYYVTLWRLMLRYPELLVWEHFYHESNREVYRLMHKRIKSVRPTAVFGIHVWHNTTMSPIYAAEQDISELTGCADFLKVAVYNNCGGPRLASYIESVAETIYGDVPPAELLQFHYRVFNYREATYEAVRKKGLGPDYVYRESTRAVRARGGGAVPILTGIDVGIPIRGQDLGGDKGTSVVLTTRQGVKAATQAALRAGVDGIVISRKYSEMHLDHLSGVGDAIKELGVSS